MLRKVISGGQTGADRAGLDAAIDAGLLHGGWCPAGRKASDGRIPERYELTETISDKYPPRTENNIKGSCGTLIFCDPSHLSPGCKLTRSLCEKHNKPYLLIDVSSLAYSDAQGDLRSEIKPIAEWLSCNRIEILNVAGSRESKSPGIYYLTYETLYPIMEVAAGCA